MFDHHSTLLRSRLKSARIPAKYQGHRLDSPHLKGYRTTPDGFVHQWIRSASEGKVIRAAGEFDTCGVGIWGRGDIGPAYFCAVLQDVMLALEESEATGLYINVEDFLDSERDFSDDAPRIPKDRDIMVLSGVGTERRTDWTDGTIRALLTRRFELGLPTLVSSLYEPTEILNAGLAREAFVNVAIMRETE